MRSRTSAKHRSNHCSRTVRAFRSVSNDTSDPRASDLHSTNEKPNRITLLHKKRWRLSLVVNTLCPINEVNRRRARLVLGWVTVKQSDKSFRYVTSHPGQLSLAIPPAVCATNTSVRLNYIKHKLRTSNIIQNLGLRIYR